MTTISVWTWSYSAESFKTGHVNANGQFLLSGLEPGQYVLFFTEGAPNKVLGTYYGGVYTEKEATRIDVTAGAAVTGITQALSPGGRIQGKVSAPYGTNLGDVVVKASDWGGFREVSTIGTGWDGSFDLGPLMPGNYVVSFSSHFGTSPFVRTNFPGVSDPALATKIVVDHGTVVTGINQVLKKSATISGAISDPGFYGVATALPIGDLGKVAGSANVTAGAYTIGGLEAGTYKIQFHSDNYSLASMWHGGVPTEVGSPTVTVSTGQQLTGVSDAPIRAATISGSFPTVDASNSVQVLALDGTVVKSDYAHGSRDYGIGGLFPGTYKVQFNMETHQTYRTPQEGQYYNNVPESAGLANATSVTVAAGQTATNINAVNRVGGTLSGKLLGVDGSPLSDIAVRVYTKSGLLITRNATTAANGTFKVTGLTTGLYFVSAEPGSESGPIFSGNVLNEANARSVSTAAGQNTDIGTLSYATATEGVRGFDDVPLGAQFQDEIQWLANRGISTGWESNGARTYQPLSPVNRDAMAAFMYRLSGSPAFTAPKVSPFKDLPSDAKFYKEITWLADKGISTGWEEADKTKTYRPLQPVNRDAMAAFMYRLAGEPEFTAPKVSPFVDVPVGAQFYKEITWLAAQGISTGWAEAGNTKSFKPLQAVNRDAMAAFMFRYNTKFGAN
ncbi:S-layer homology domain-containing protein [Paenarthrobacter sp. NPDC056912]|uniref:S-layer homology domain-containing protein n=1 Tax=Paenarthrobacter sp. NPDC056912 TaxID=3345965 RepID=UPI003670DFF1